MMTLSEAAKRLKVNTAVLLYAIKSGKLEARKSGKSWLVSVRALNSYVNKCRAPKNVAAATTRKAPMTTDTPKAPLPSPSAKKHRPLARHLQVTAQISRMLSDLDTPTALLVLDTLRAGYALAAAPAPII